MNQQLFICFSRSALLETKYFFNQSVTSQRHFLVGAQLVRQAIVLGRGRHLAACVVAKSAAGAWLAAKVNDFIELLRHLLFILTHASPCFPHALSLSLSLSLSRPQGGVVATLLDDALTERLRLSASRYRREKFGVRGATTTNSTGNLPSAVGCVELT